MENKIAVYLVLSGFPDDPNEITIATGLQPHEVWRRGDRIGPTSRYREENGWKLSAGVESSVDLEQQIQHLLQKIEPATSVLADLGAKHELEIACVLRAYDHVPAMHLSRSAIQAFAHLGAEVDLDLYYLVEEA